MREKAAVFFSWLFSRPIIELCGATTYAVLQGLTALPFGDSQWWGG